MQPERFLCGLLDSDIYIFVLCEKLETDSGKLGEFWNWNEAADALERGME